MREGFGVFRVQIHSLTSKLWTNSCSFEFEMAPDATANSYFHWSYVADGTHQEVDVGAAAQVPSPHQTPPPPFQELQPPYQELQPPYQELQPPYQELQPHYQGLHQESVPLFRRQVPKPKPYHRQVPQSGQPRRRDFFLGINPVLDVGVYSAIGIRSGYRKVMGERGSRRRRAAKVGAVAGAAAAAVVAGATVAGGILVVIL